AGGDEPVDVDLAGKPAVDELRHLGTPFHAAERRARDATAGDQEARYDVELLALAGDAAHRRQAPGLAGRLGRLLHHSDVSGRFEGVVRAEAAGLAPNPVDGVLGGDARVRRAVVPRLGEALVGEVDRDDPFGAREPAADHAAEADEPAAEDGARGAWLDARGVERGADTGREPAGERRAPRERRLEADLRQRDFGDDGVLGEGRRAHEVPELLTVSVQARRPVREIA